MGLWANYPIALAPGMSLNAYFTYSIVLGRGVPWKTALGVVFLSGVLFLLLTLCNIREQVYRDAVSLGYVLRTIGRGDSGLCHGSCAGARERRRARPMALCVPGFGIDWITDFSRGMVCSIKHLEAIGMLSSKGCLTPSMRNHVRNDRWRWRPFSSERESGS